MITANVIQIDRPAPARSAQAPTACSSCSLARICLPLGLNKAELERMDGIVARAPVAHEGDHLFRVGDAFKAVYAVRSGSYKSYTVDSEGREHVLGFHLPGEIMGLDAIYSERHACNAVALDTAAVCILPYSELSALSGKIDNLRTQMFRLMSKDIADTAALAGDFTAEERIASFLVDLSRRFQLRGFSAAEFNLNMSRRDIANYLRLAPETVSRVLARFEKSRLIAVVRREIRLLDMARLQELGRCIGEMHA
ncbi:MAG TPA: fumarate/nitrate reduction transcriptional regulator Fnr [Gammaproteobacteria bacterium]|nr:fumarate/nitrate reduction transcriptional regulator Fnr [Gammaproteobacteria bacterium]